MESLANNDESVIGVAADANIYANVEDEGQAASVHEFFKEADDVHESLHRAIAPALEPQECRQICERIKGIWGQYQEQPGLLDPHLERMIGPIIGAIAGAVQKNPKRLEDALPNVHLLASLLYVLSTVRGYKVVARFFPHEAADLESALEAAEAEAADKGAWATRYCLQLWLAMVLFTPFDLRSIDSGGDRGLSTRLLELGLLGLKETGRQRDAAAWMLAKYFARPDVAADGALTALMEWTKAQWEATEDSFEQALRGFSQCGALQAWNQTLKAAPRSVLANLREPLMRLALKGPSEGGAQGFAGSSLLRKLRVAVATRTALAGLPVTIAPWRYERGARSLLPGFAQDSTEKSTTAVKPEEEDEEEDDGEDIPEETEEVLELLLTSLSDDDTVVRWAAAKGIGRVTNRLPKDFGDQVVESLVERTLSFRETDKSWHGGCLALAELARRGLLLPVRLSEVTPLVCQALHFEQQTGQHTVGQHVRDAACYVAWAFARAYAPDVLAPYVEDLANALIQVAVYDREINCRRAASAACQEHVGRQGTFPDGIAVVTIADYWTISSRRHSYMEVAPQIATLGKYRRNLIDHLVIKKLVHSDVQIRLLASQAFAKLTKEMDEEGIKYLNESVVPKLLERAQAEVQAGSGGNTLASRHGAVVGIAELVLASPEKIVIENQNKVRALVPGLEKARAYRGRGGEIMRQGACHLLETVAKARSWQFKDATCARYQQTIDECIRHSTDAIQFAAVDALRMLAHCRYSTELGLKVVDSFIAGLNKAEENVGARRGYALGLGMLKSDVLRTRCQEILEVLSREVRGVSLPGGADQDDPQTRQYASLSLGFLIEVGDLDGEALSTAVGSLEAAMGDYAVDTRGDVGSWVRDAAMEVAAMLLERHRRGAAASLEPAAVTRLLALMLQQAVEKIDRTRDRACLLLHRLLCCDGPAFSMMWAYRRICHSEQYGLTGPEMWVDPLNPESSYVSTNAGVTDAAGGYAQSDAQTSPSGNLPLAPSTPSKSWPPPHYETLVKAASELGARTGGADVRWGDVSTAFARLIPLLDCTEYRRSLVLGLIASVGGVTESTSREASKCLLAYLKGGDSRVRDVAAELLFAFDLVGSSDDAPDAKRLAVPLLNMLGVLLSHDCFPQCLANDLCDRVVAAVSRSKDLVRVKSAAPVFVGLLRWPGGVRRRAFMLHMTLLGHRFPKVRHIAAQALYVRLLEEDAEFDLSSEDNPDAMISKVTLDEVVELLTVTPWLGDLKGAAEEARRSMYAKLGLPLPKSLQEGYEKPEKKSQGTKTKEIGNSYADLVKDEHF